jgi:hypothetical protein
MDNKKSNLYIFLGSVAFIIAAIVMTSVISFNKSDTKNTDVRARASGSSVMVLKGTILEYDETNSLAVVDNMTFEDSTEKTLGTWKVTYPPTFNPASFPAGSKVKITAKPALFQISTKTLTATEITR